MHLISLNNLQWPDVYLDGLHVMCCPRMHANIGLYVVDEQM